MKKFKKKNKRVYSELEVKSVDNKARKKKIIKIAGLVVLIIVIFSVGYYFQKNSSSSNNKYLIPNGTVSVIDAEGQAPSTSAVQKGTSIEQPAQNPSGAATVEDMGGNNNSPSGIDTLLEGKNIEIKK